MIMIYTIKNILILVIVGLVASRAANLNENAYNYKIPLVEHFERRVSNEVVPQIVGGSPVPAGSYPYFSRGNGCGAALIASDLLVSAAHCEGAFSSTVRVNASYFGVEGNGTIVVDGVAQIIHPKYHSDPTAADYDLMIVKISPPVKNVTPILLNRDPLIASDGATLLAMGFGQTSDTTSPVSSTTASVSLVSNNCRSFYISGVR
jgi:hypothetical protein